MARPAGPDDVSAQAPATGRFVLVAAAAALVLVAAAPFVLLGDRVPDPMATHWGGGGRPDGAGSVASTVGVFVGAAAVVGALLVLVASRRRPGRGELSGPASILVFIGAFLAVVGWEVVLANLDATRWDRAGRLAWAEITLAFAVGLLCGFAAFVVGRTAEGPTSWDLPAPPEAPPRHEAAAVDPGATWTGTARSRWALPTALGIVAVSLGFVPLGLGALGAVQALLALVVLPFTSVRVRVDATGLRSALGVLGWPTVRLPIERVARATVIDVRPLQWGGWGYRGGLRWFGRAALVLRGGPAIRVDLVDGTVFVVTVDDPAGGATLLEALRPPDRPPAPDPTQRRATAPGG